MDMSSAMIVVMAVMMLAMIGAAAWGAGATLRSRRQARRERSAKEVLDRRYASGEITAAEHDEMLRTLGHTGGDEPSNTSRD
jgi:uncharacterized membrane protein